MLGGCIKTTMLNEIVWERVAGPRLARSAVMLPQRAGARDLSLEKGSLLTGMGTGIVAWEGLNENQIYTLC